MVSDYMYGNNQGFEETLINLNQGLFRNNHTFI